MIQTDKSIIFARMPVFPLDIVRGIFALKNTVELEKHVRMLLRDKDFAETLWSLNENFFSRIESKSSWSEKELQTVVLYILRMSYRPTPLGRVVGLAKLKPGRENSFLKNETMKLEHFPATPIRSLEESLQAFEKNPAAFTYLTNPTLVRKGNTCWFIDRKGSEDKTDFFRGKAALEPEGRELLEFCRSPRTFAELLSEFEVERADAAEFTAFLKEYIDAHLLEFDHHSSLVSPKHAKSDQSEQVKISLPENEISVSEMHAMDKAINGLYRISRVWDDRLAPWFVAIKEEFRKNYVGEWIPLLDFILFHLPESEKAKSDELVQAPNAEEWLQLLGESALLGKDEISLTEEMINRFEIPSVPDHRGHPDPAYSMIFSMGKEKGRYRGKYMFGIEGWEGVRGYSRFIRHHDDLACSQPEESEGKILVDLEFYPGSVAAGASIREESIRNFVRISHMRSDGRRKYIDLSGIEVTLQNDLFALRCRETGKKLIPALTTAHIVHAHNHPVFRFFGFLAVEGKKTFLNVPWTPDSMGFVPAISYRGFLLSSRKWTLKSQVLRSLATDIELRAKLRMPRWIVISELDNIIPMDLESPVTAILLGKFPDDRILIVEEEWHFTHSSHIEVGKKDYSHEVQFQWKPTASAKTELTPVIAPEVKLSSQSDNIHAFHFHLPEELLDAYLLDVLLPLARTLQRQKFISHFYFVKFSRPQPQIRFRLFTKKKTDLGDQFLLKALTKKGLYLVHNAYQVPFELELETYGGETGLQLYHELSSVFSESFPSTSRLRETLSRSGHSTYGEPMDLAYLVLLARKLSAHETFGPQVLDLQNQEAGSGVKMGMAHFRRNHLALLNEESLQKNLNQLMSKLDPVLDKLNKNFSAKKIKVSRQHYFRRLIHMQVFRISSGSSPFLEAIAYRMAAERRP